MPDPKKMFLNKKIANSLFKTINYFDKKDKTNYDANYLVELEAQKYQNELLNKKNTTKSPTLGKAVTATKEKAVPVMLGNTVSTNQLESTRNEALYSPYESNFLTGSDIMPEYINNTESLKENTNSPFALSGKMKSLGVNLEMSNPIKLAPTAFNQGTVDENGRTYSGVVPVERDEKLWEVPNMPTDFTSRKPTTQYESVDTRPKKEAEGLMDTIEKDLKNQKTLGILGYGLQGASAAMDWISNENQPYSSAPKMMIPNRIGFTPTDIDPYNRKMDQTTAGYMKYLKETGNAQMLPSLYGMEDKRNEMYAQVTDANNKGQMQVDATNAQIEGTTNQMNAQLMSDYEKLKLTESQYKDQARRSNKQALFGSLAGIGKTLSGDSSQKLKLKAIKQAIDSGNIQLGMRMINDQFYDTGVGASSKREAEYYKSRYMDVMEKTKTEEEV
jgi:hypothetical protein